MGARRPAWAVGSAPRARGSKVTGSPCVKGGRWGRGASLGGAATASDVAGTADDLVDEAVLEGLGRGEPLVATGAGGDLLRALAGLLREQRGERALHRQDQTGLDLDVRGGSAQTAQRLVHQHPGVRGGVALALGAGGEQELAHRGG